MVKDIPHTLRIG